MLHPLPSLKLRRRPVIHHSLSQLLQLELVNLRRMQSVLRLRLLRLRVKHPIDVKRIRHIFLLVLPLDLRNDLELDVDRHVLHLLLVDHALVTFMCCDQVHGLLLESLCDLSLQDLVPNLIGRIEVLETE